MSRLDNCFQKLRLQKRSALIPFITAGDPSFAESLDIMHQLPESGADIIELGIAFSDPMADGPVIQASSLRALRAGQTLSRSLDMVTEFRKNNQTTPVILMSYYNPIFAYGLEKFQKQAIKAGVDGIIIVDVPLEESQELDILRDKLSIIQLVAPTTEDNRLKNIIKQAQGFIYYIAIRGITGTTSANLEQLRSEVTALRTVTASMPIAVGFGINSPEKAAEVAKFSDAVVIGSAFVKQIENYQKQHNQFGAAGIEYIISEVRRYHRAIQDTSMHNFV